MKLRFFAALLCTVAQTAIAQAADKSSASCTVFERGGWETLVTATAAEKDSQFDASEIWIMGEEPSLVAYLRILPDESFRLSVSAYGQRDQLVFTKNTMASLKNTGLTVDCKIK